MRGYERGNRRFRAGSGPDELIEDGPGSRWRIEEEALVSAAGALLTRLAGHLAFWFGWFAFHPDTPGYGR